MCTWRALFQVQALNTGSSTVVLVKELGLMLELPRILLNMYQVYTQVFFFIPFDFFLRLPQQHDIKTSLAV